MTQIQLHIDSKITTISNEFIDDIMPYASGEFVKVYLFVLRAAQSQIEFTVADAADGLRMTERDVLRALKYWQEKGLFNLSFAEGEDLNQIEVLDKEKTANTTIEEPKKEIKPVATKNKRYSQKQINNMVSTDKALADLNYMIEKGIGKTLSAAELEQIVYIYDVLKLPVEVMEYLIDYCISNNHKKMSYIVATAAKWAEEGIDTVEKAKQNSELFKKSYYAVMKEFGITGRAPANEELNKLKKWFQDIKMSEELVIEACRRTIKLTHQPSFEYADSIIVAWNAQGVKNMQDVKRLDENYSKTKTVAEVKQTVIARATTKPKSPNKFQNYEQREYDYAALEQELLKKQMKAN